jgi:hypothetical protein
VPTPSTPYPQTVEEAAVLLRVYGQPGRKVADELTSGLAAHEASIIEECARRAEVQRCFLVATAIRALHRAAPQTEAFCACGRRVAECDGSRAGCKPPPPPDAGGRRCGTCGHADRCTWLLGPSFKADSVKCDWEPSRWTPRQSAGEEGR